MDTPQAHPRVIRGVRRRELLKTGLAAGVTLSAWPLPRPQVLWAAEAGPPKRGGILRVRGLDPPHFDPHFTLNGCSPHRLWCKCLDSHELSALLSEGL